MKRHQQGFTLIETVMFLIIVGLALAAMSQLYSSNVAHSSEPLLRQKAISLANFYMDEILRKKWNENTPDGGGCVNTGSGSCATGPAAAAIGTDGQSRATYNDVDDYNGINESPPKDQSGAALSDFTGFTARVSVSNSGFNPTSDANHDVPAADSLRIQVDIDIAATNETITLIAYRSNF